MSIQPLTLFRLAYTSRLYRALTDDYLGQLYTCVGSKIVDPEDKDHRRAVLAFLNRWGCRQFARDYHSLASQELLRWSRRWAASLPERGKRLMEFTDNELADVQDAFDALLDKTASYKHRDGRKLRVRFGATGVAKILYVLRPKAFLPWDRKIRDALDFGESGREYRRFLEHVRVQINDLIRDARHHSISDSQIPKAVGREGTSLTKLIDEYHWVKITMGCEPPTADELRQWLGWLSVSEG